MPPTLTPARKPVRTLAALIVLLGASAAWADDAADKFHRAYYLEREQRDFDAAAKLYAEVSGDRSADKELRDKAKARQAACQEEQTTTDFARLMPEDALAYIELNRPGERVLGLLRTLGLVADAESAAREGGKRVAISPALVREVLGIRGAAVAVTGFDAFTQTPTGVAVFHPGDVEIIRGLIESALPAASERIKDIEGCATYRIEDEVVVTLTQRLIIVSQQPAEIAGVIERMRDNDADSLATNADLKEVLSDRADALLFFCVNAKPVLPIVTAMLGAVGGSSPEMALANATLDIGSLRAISGQLNVGEEGLRLDVSLRLAEGHKNLVYNFLRLPPLDRETLKCVPAGAAMFGSFALNERASRFNGQATPAKDERPIVTALDLGREFFANMIGITVFLLPPEQSGRPGGSPIPDVAAVMSVNDPAKSEALWGQCLGLAALAAGGSSIEGEPTEISGVTARTFALPGGVTIRMATLDNELIISPSAAAIGKAIATRRGGKCVLDDPAYERSLARLDEHSTVAMFAHAGRCFEVARGYMGDDADEVAPFAERLTETVGSLVITHSDQLYKLSFMLTGLPRVDDLVTQLLEDGEIRPTAAPARTAVAAAPAEADDDRPRAAEAPVAAYRPVAEERPADEARPAGDARSLERELRKLVADEETLPAAREVAVRLMELANDDAEQLNTLAWRWLTAREFHGRLNELALRASQRGNELTQHKNWMHVDTLAWAHFKAGEVARAVELERKALELCGEDDRAQEVKDALAKFEAALRGKSDDEDDDKEDTR